MKKITLFTFLLLSLHTFSQENISEGIVVQKQSLSSTNEQMNTQLAMLGDMQTITYFKANKSRSEMSNPMAGETTTIMDNDKKEMLILINNAQLGKKYAIKSLTPSEESLKNIIITPSDETKTILGYDCKRYDIASTTDEMETKLVLYTTDKIGAMSEQLASFGNKISGFPMYLEINATQMGMDMTVKMEVIEVKNEKINEEKFSIVIPEGYEESASLLGN
jgi:hypothetical protein